jgi:hypothetical protein
MADSYNLKGLKTSLSEMSDDELRAHMLSLRSNRRTVKAKAIELSAKGQKDGTNTKASTKQTIKSLSAEQVQQLLLQLGQGA